MAFRSARELAKQLESLKYPDVPQGDDGLLNLFFGSDASRATLLLWLFVHIDEDTNACLESAADGPRLRQALVDCFAASGYRCAASFVNGISSIEEQCSTWQLLMGSVSYCSEETLSTTGATTSSSGTSESALHRQHGADRSVRALQRRELPRSTAATRSTRPTLKELEKKVHALKEDMKAKNAMLSKLVPVVLPDPDRAREICDEVNNCSTPLVELKHCVEGTLLGMADLPARASTTTDALIREAATLSRQVTSFLGALQKAGNYQELPDHIQETAEEAMNCEPCLPRFLHE